MGAQVVTGASMMCSFGVAPSTLVVTIPRVLVNGVPAATINDSVPFVNVMPFGVCTSLANPTVASATAAALGVLTPMPCTPVTAGPWTPGAPTTLIGGIPALTQPAFCQCAYGGTISITSPGQFTMQVT